MMHEPVADPGFQKRGARFFFCFAFQQEGGWGWVGG